MEHLSLVIESPSASIISPHMLHSINQGHNQVYFVVSYPRLWPKILIPDFKNMAKSDP